MENRCYKAKWYRIKYILIRLQQKETILEWNVMFY